MLIPKDSGDEGAILDPYPWVKAWHERMEGRESWKRAMMLREKLMGEQGLGRNGMPEGVSDIGEYEEFIRRKEEEERVNEEGGVLGCVGVRSISGYQEGQGKQGEKDGEEEERWDEQTGLLGCVGVRSIGENQEKEARQEDGKEKEERWDEDTGVLGCIGVGNLGGYREKQQGQGERREQEQEDRWDEDTGVLGCSKIGH